MSEWQPIETAPKDGTWILLGGGDTDEGCTGDDLGSDPSRPVTSKWKPVKTYADEDGKGGYEYIEGFWVYDFWDSAWRSVYKRPTHWMPLPAPPVT